MKPLVFTLIGADKPGLVESLAQQVQQLGGNWLGSHFAHMAGHFAGFVEVDLPPEQHPQLIQQFKQHPDLQIQLVSADSHTLPAQQTFTIQVIGNDRIGIVQQVSAVLNRHQVNIVRFQSSCESAPNWGNKLFKASAQVSAPQQFDIDSLRDALEQIANDLVVDIDITST